MDTGLNGMGANTENAAITLNTNSCHLSVLQGAAGSKYFTRGQCRVQSGAEVPENPAGGGAGARSSFQALPTQHPLSVHGAGLPGRGRGQLVFTCHALTFIQKFDFVCI